jgi:hypothetical protein
MSEHLVSIHRAVKPTWNPSTFRTHHSNVKKPTPEAPLIVSVSEIAAFLRCRVKWHLGFQLRLIRKTGLEALHIGSLTHDIIDKWYQLGGPKDRTVKAMKAISRKIVKAFPLKELTTEDRNLVEAMCNGYAAWVLDPNNEDNDKRIGLVRSFPEEWFTVPLRKDKSILLRGRFDNRFVSTAAKKTLGAFETKTRGQFRDENLEQTIQLSGYLLALRHEYPQYKNYQMWFQRLRKQMPGPRVSAPLFDRMLVERDVEEIEQWRRDAERTAIDMLDAAIYPSPMDSCAYACDFRGPCLLRGNPDDVKHVLKSEYKIKESR